MIARANFTLDERYFRAFYADWVRHRSKVRSYWPIFATVVLLGGILMLCFPKRSRTPGYSLLAIGIVYLIDAVTYGRRWVRRRLRSGGSTTARFDFYEDRIFMKTERSEGDHQLPGFVDITSADHGVFLYPQRDIYFYIPWDSIEPAEAIPKVRELLISKGTITG